MTEAALQAIVVRPVLPAEHRAVAALTVEVYRSVIGHLLSDAYLVELSDVARRAREAVVLVAIDPSDRLLGSVTYVPGLGPYAEFHSPDEAGIRMLVVDPAVQRRGVGTALVQACIERARAAGKVRITLHTVADMVDAQRLYQRLGFRRAPQRDLEPEPGVMLLGYELDL